MSQMSTGYTPSSGRNSQMQGRMTAVMRAMTLTGPKVLRIGVVHRGRILEERLVKQRTTVTIGPSEGATFIVPGAGIPAQFRLFELVGNEYVLNVLDGMGGRVALPTGVTEVAALHSIGRRVGNITQVRLSEEARGKITIGETTFLFQFVVAPPPQARPQLPLAVKGGLLADVDWNLTIVAAFSFLLHFGMIGILYSDWMDPVINEDTVIQGLIDMTRNIPPAPVEEKTTPDNAKPSTTAAATAAAPTKGGAATKANTAGAGASKGSVSDARAAALTQQAQAMGMEMLAAFGGNSAVQGALARSDIPPVDLSGAAASQVGVAHGGSSDLRLGTGGSGPVQPGRQGGGGLQGIAGATTAQAAATAGTARDVGGPKGDAQLGGTTMSVPVTNAEAVVARMRPRFRSCYQTGLNVDPSMSGKVVIIAKIGPNGEVDSANVASNSGLSDQVTSCLVRTVRNTTFDAPGPQGSTIQIPISFVQQGR